MWARCVELGVAVTVHSPAQGYGLRTSSSRYMYNHIGNFGAAGDAFAKAVFFGGVAHRFPTLTFAFLEGGVAWGVQLLCDLVDRWHKRGGDHIAQYDPARLDRAEWDDLFDRYGGARFADPAVRAAMAVQSDTPPVELDDFRDAGATSELDIVRQFERFYFGCEADDATISWAFARDVNPHGAELRPILGSDLGHWDVADMTDVLPEAYELVEHGLVDADQFRGALVRQRDPPARFDEPGVLRRHHRRGLRPRTSSPPRPPRRDAAGTEAAVDGRSAGGLEGDDRPHSRGQGHGRAPGTRRRPCGR